MSVSLERVLLSCVSERRPEPLGFGDRLLSFAYLFIYTLLLLEGGGLRLSLSWVGGYCSRDTLLI